MTALLGRDAPSYHQLHTSAGTINATAEHPFWVIDKGWIAAKDLQPQDRLATAKGEALLFENGFQNEQARVYNFTVANSHTYFVAANKDSADDIWVHNAGKATCWDAGEIDLEGLDPALQVQVLGRQVDVYEIKIGDEYRLVYTGKDGRYYDYEAHSIDFSALTDKELGSFRDRIDAVTSDTAKDNIRYERYSVNQAKQNKPVKPREEWQNLANQARNNQITGQAAENAARTGLSDALGENIRDNNGPNPITLTHTDIDTGKTTNTRPDGISSTTIYEHKNLTGQQNTVYNTKQIVAQREWAANNGLNHVVSMSSPNGPGSVRPSSNLVNATAGSSKLKSTIHFTDADGKPTHTWNKDEGNWDVFSASGY